MGIGNVSEIVSAVVRMPCSVPDMPALLAGCLSPYGKITQVGSCLVVSDYLYNCKKVFPVIQSLRDNGQRSYIAEVFLVRMEQADLIDLQCRLSSTGVDVFSCTWNLETLFSAYLDVSGQRSKARVEHRPVLYLSEGREASLDVGSDVTRSRFAVSDTGYSTTSGYDTFSDGLQITLTPYRISTDVISLDVDVTVSSFGDDNKAMLETEIPVISKSAIKSPGVLVSDGRIAFLGSLVIKQESKAGNLFGYKNQKMHEVLTVWVRVREVVLN